MATFNFSELQQKADRVIHNADELVRKWMEFIAAPAGTVTLEYYDRNGNLQMVTFSNRNKLVQDFIANTNSVMSKTIYVDQLNGNDGNDGSLNNPVATINKAVSMIPAGGRGVIVVQGDYDVSNSTALETVLIYDKSIEIRLNGTLRVGWTQDQSGRDVLTFIVIVVNGNVAFRLGNVTVTNGTIEILDRTTTNNIYGPRQALIHCGHGGISSVTVDAQIADNTVMTPLILGKDAHLIQAQAWSYRKPTLMAVAVEFYCPTTGSTVVVNDPTVSAIVQLNPWSTTPTSLHWYFSGVALQDAAGNALTPNQVIQGIIYDSTATTVPVNVTSNVDL